MKVTFCDCGTKYKPAIIESRPHEVGGVMTTRRRRECSVCGTRWSTAELPLAIVEDVLDNSV